MRRYLLLFSMLYTIAAFGQKKPLDHSVYDSWESIGERHISNNGQWVVFTVNPQEGDGVLWVKNANASKSIAVPRGFDASITADSRWVIFKIKPTFKATREARIKKKKQEDFPKDSLGWLALGEDTIHKIPRIKSYKIPDEGSWMVYVKEKPLPIVDSVRKNVRSTLTIVDSTKLLIDSLQMLINKLPANIKQKYLDENTGLEFVDALDADEPTTNSIKTTEDGNDLIWLNFLTGKQQLFKNVTEYAIDSINGKVLLLETAKNGRDSSSINCLLWINTLTGRMDTLLKGFNDVKNMRLSQNAEQLAFLVEKDSSAKAVRKFYKLYHYRIGNDAAQLLVDHTQAGFPKSSKVGEFAKLSFSNSGERLFFGIAPILALKDTSLPDFERAGLDIWHYNDEFLQPQQLRNLNRDLEKSYTAVYHFSTKQMVPLANPMVENVSIGRAGDAANFVANDNKPYRVAAQWTGGGKNDVYAIDPTNGAKTLLVKALYGNASLSNAGNYIVWYDRKSKHYFAWSKFNGVKKITSTISVPLFEEDNDVPDEPGAYGIMAWHKNDSLVYIYDRYDIWAVDPTGNQKAINITSGKGRANKLQIRYQPVRKEPDAGIENGQLLNCLLFNEVYKTAGWVTLMIGNQFSPISSWQTFPLAVTPGSILKAKNENAFIYGTETPQQSGNICMYSGENLPELGGKNGSSIMLYQPNPQQKDYNWLKTKLISWKAYDGKTTEGILYLPEDFDSTKKYPLIAYFYEKLSDGLYRYQPPAPTPSRLNIPFFVSRGYLVLAPDISYKTGQPGQDAFDYVVSGVRHVVKMGVADSTRLGLQGQSWGGYQIAQMITMTSLFKAAWAGAPVVNMTSAYGGIRWESGLNRQFQYEKSQSRIGASLWERPDLYLKNSPLFQLPKVTTPLVIMANDTDGAVPWYQGIEMFTAMRRLGKQVWMLNYNGEAHNLVERRNRKDIQIREQQFFDWLLKDAPAPKWLTNGLPAIEKGTSWGLGYTP